MNRRWYRIYKSYNIFSQLSLTYPLPLDNLGRDMSIINSYRDLIVWQKSMDLCVETYRITNSFPKSELYGLVSQIRRCSVSIPSNIAEGFYRTHRLEYKRFLSISYGSGAELETQMLLAKRIGYIDEECYLQIEEKLKEVMKMLNKLIKRVSHNYSI